MTTQIELLLRIFRISIRINYNPKSIGFRLQNLNLHEVEAAEGSAFPAPFFEVLVFLILAFVIHK